MLTVPVEVRAHCGGSLNAQKKAQHFVSPGYPDRYEAHKTCKWIIDAPDDGHRVILEFDEGFNLPSSPNCTSDRLDIYDGMTLLTSNKRFLGISIQINLSLRLSKF